IQREVGLALVQRQQIARDDLDAAASILGGQHVRLFTDGVTAEDTLVSRLIFGAVKIIVRRYIADKRKILCAPEAFAEQNRVLDDARVLKFLGGSSLHSQQRRIESNLVERARRYRAEAGVCRKIPAVRGPTYLSSML